MLSNLKRIMKLGSYVKVNFMFCLILPRNSDITRLAGRKVSAQMSFQ
jgi:hypothetical protein